MRRLGSILYAQMRASMLLSMQYRAEFFIGGLFALLSISVTIVPLAVVYGTRPSIAGWTFYEALVVVGLFTLLKSILNGAIFPSLLSVVDHVRKGTLDFVLIKPADAQFLVSTARVEPWRLSEAMGATVILGIAFAHLDTLPSLGNLLAGLTLLTAATGILYSLLILVVALSFIVVRVDNLSFLISSIFDAGRWPVTIFRGVVRILFTFVLPLALMTTFPAMALLGRLDWTTGLGSLAGAGLFLGLSRLAWRAALRRYTSASS